MASVVLPSYGALPQPAILPGATLGVDATGDGRANYVVSGVDMNRDGIPDVLQSPRLMAPTVPVMAPVTYAVPAATAVVDSTGDGFANYCVSGVDMNRDGIPDVLQSPRLVSRVAVPAVPVAAALPGATVGVDVTGDRRANYVVSGVDMNRDGIPDVLQTPVTVNRMISAPAVPVAAARPITREELALSGRLNATMGSSVVVPPMVSSPIASWVPATSFAPVPMPMAPVPSVLSSALVPAPTTETTIVHPPFMGPATVYPPAPATVVGPPLLSSALVPAAGFPTVPMSGSMCVPPAGRFVGSMSLPVGGRITTPISGSLAAPVGPGVGRVSVGLDTTGDGMPNYRVTGWDRNHDGIPDVLQSPWGMGAVAPAATMGFDATGDGRANYVVSGVDMNRDGIPDVLQSPRMMAPPVMASAIRPSIVAQPVTRFSSMPAYGALPAPTATTPRVSVQVDTTGDGIGNYRVTGWDRNRDGIPDVLQSGPGVPMVV